jgi:small subunit ribosomal protein S4e
MSKHVKRLAIPRSWPVARKVSKWAPKSSPGPHALENSIPLLIALRDILGLCDTRGEAKRIVGRKEILVDNVIVTNEKRPLGLMDTLSIPKEKANYRVYFDKRGKIRLSSINKEDVKWKLAKIVDKTVVNGGKIQLNLHDGRNIIIDKDTFKTGDVLKIELPSQKIISKIEFVEGNLAFLTGGSHVGHIATVEKIEKTRNPKSNIVHFKEEFSTHVDHVFMIGTDVPEVDIQEAIT